MKARKVKVLIGLLVSLGAPFAQADNDVEGSGGVLNITGSLYETPCSLAMASQHQTVDLDVVSRNELKHPGDQAMPMAFQIRLQDCRRTAGSIRSERSGNLVWSAYEPVLSATFVAPADADDPRLVKVQGVTGMGLQLTDLLGRDVTLGSRGEPLFLALGDNTLTWYVHPTRTSAPLTNGAFRSVVDFRLNYE
ncbi:fimbrial protein [Pseudomonas simiae]|jgi:type 1 fimbria pilin|uniref:Fimbrial protein n=1 Tax=Pseudomonas simiae TaxID=321846 RepID=A0A1N7ULG6_9PSED|nr:fimbrial protein [Pseudomonas simiae]AIB38778.1 fimbrial protein [Pseudomonas simiae]